MIFSLYHIARKAKPNQIFLYLYSVFPDARYAEYRPPLRGDANSANLFFAAWFSALREFNLSMDKMFQQDHLTRFGAGHHMHVYLENLHAK